MTAYVVLRQGERIEFLLPSMIRLFECEIDKSDDGLVNSSISHFITRKKENDIVRTSTSSNKYKMDWNFPNRLGWCETSPAHSDFQLKKIQANPTETEEKSCIYFWQILCFNLFPFSFRNGILFIDKFPIQIFLFLLFFVLFLFHCRLLCTEFSTNFVKLLTCVLFVDSTRLTNKIVLMNMIWILNQGQAVCYCLRGERKSTVNNDRRYY